MRVVVREVYGLAPLAVRPPLPPAPRRIRAASGILLPPMHVPAASAVLALSSAVLLGGCAALGIAAPLPAGADPLAVPGTSPLPALSPAPAPAASPGYLASAGGWNLSLPAGWTAAELDMLDAAAAGELVSVLEPGLAPLVREGLTRGDARIALLAIDARVAVTGGLPPSFVLVAIPTRGLPRDTARTLVEALLAAAPALEAPRHSVVPHPAGDAHRWELRLAGTTGILDLRAELLRIAGDGWLILSVAPDALAEAARPDLDLIVRSLRFGI